MKQKLMIQSLSPLALLTIIKNCSFVTRDETGINLATCAFIRANLPLLCVLAVCVLWCVLSAIFLISFNAFKYAGRKQGFSIVIVEKKEEASLNFFFTLILPLLVDDVNTWHGAVLFFAIVFLTWRLLSSTKLFYANPILSILGYRITEIAFVENKEKPNDSYIVLSRGELDDKHNIEYKDITTDVLFAKGMAK